MLTTDSAQPACLAARHRRRVAHVPVAARAPGSRSPRCAWRSSSRWSTTRCCRSRCRPSAVISAAAPPALQWVTGAYSLTFGGLLLTAGSAADRLGRRRVLLVGLAAFGTISLFVVAVTSAGELIALRAALGVTAAAMAPITNSLVFRLFDAEALRMRAMTLMIVVGMTGFILGPLLGGTVLAHVRWEWLLADQRARSRSSPGSACGSACPPTIPTTSPTTRSTSPARVLSIATIGLGCWSLTSGVRPRLDVADHARLRSSERSSPALRSSTTSAAARRRCSTCACSPTARCAAPPLPRSAPPSPWPA